MNETIKLDSRDSTENRLELLHRKDGGESKTYLLKTSSPTLRVCQSGGIVQFIDPSGGPKIEVGKPVVGADNAVVRSIDFSEGFGYTITFK